MKINTRCIEVVNIGKNELQTYNSIVEEIIGITLSSTNYLTMELLVNGEPVDFRLIKNNTPKEGIYKDLYVDNDGYYYLELYCRCDDDSIQYLTLRSWKISNLDEIKKGYKGIKILYRNSDMPSGVYTYNF